MNLYVSKKISGSLIMLGEKLSGYMLDAMPLVIGDKKAALIDTGLGFQGLPQYVRKFTDQPVILIATHAHPDHIGGAPLFHEIHMSKLDDDIIPSAMSLQSRTGGLPGMCGDNEEMVRYCTENIVPHESFDYLDILDGDTFDLGGVILEAIHVPGHTRGSMCFVNRAEGYALTGDAINQCLWMFLNHSQPIARYVEAVRRFYDRTKGINMLFCGHSLEPLPQGIVPDMIACGEEILAGKNRNDVRFKVPFPVDGDVSENVFIHHYGEAAIVYNKNHI